MPRIRSWTGDIRGVAAIEYAIIASLIGCVIVVSARTVGTNIGAVFAAVMADPVATPTGPTPNAYHGGTGP